MSLPLSGMGRGAGLALFRNKKKTRSGHMFSSYENISSDPY